MPQKSFGMQEQHRLAVRADLRLAVAEHARALAPSAGRARRGCRRPRSRGDGCRRPGCARGTSAIGESVAERLQQLDLGVRQVDEHDGDAVLGLRHGCRDRRRRACRDRPRAALRGRGTAMATWLSRPIMRLVAHIRPATHTISTCTWQTRLLAPVLRRRRRAPPRRTASRDRVRIAAARLAAALSKRLDRPRRRRSRQSARRRRRVSGMPISSTSGSASELALVGRARSRRDDHAGEAQPPALGDGRSPRRATSSAPSL